MAVGLLGCLLFGDFGVPIDFSAGFANRMPDTEHHPVFPMMFVSITCGAISGFHATQSPMMARCLKTKLARPVYLRRHGDRKVSWLLSGLPRR